MSRSGCVAIMLSLFHSWMGGWLFVTNIMHGSSFAPCLVGALLDWPAFDVRCCAVTGWFQLTIPFTTPTMPI
eukprot:168560-Amphidinium_carterae.1